ncbi:MAG: DUF1800 family protein [Acidobacteriia bacterium]|nr:DUF1800 family protein [Terriglobia bacterium]
MLRRLTFAATPSQQRAIEGKPLPAAFRSLVAASREAALPETPAVARGTWTNRALRFTDTTNSQIAAMRNAVSQSNRRDAAVLREWWLQEMINGTAPLRENLVLFFHGVFGGSGRVIDGPQALYGYNALLRKAVFGTIPDMVEAMVLDPGMIMQESYEEAKKEKPPEFSATRVFDNWTIGPGNYSREDTMALARALTGWVLEASEGVQPPKPIDPQAFTSNRRMGLNPVFHPEFFDDGPKTILGTTRNFGARDAVRFLAMHDLTARRFSKLMIRHFGVEDPDGRLAGQMTETYHTTKGSVEALLADLVMSQEFWSPASRWNLVKSPVHLVVGVCRQLGISNPPFAAIDTWMTASGQTLLDAPNFGGEGWPGQEEWTNPPERLAARYQLGAALCGGDTSWGLLPETPVPSTAPAVVSKPLDRPLPSILRRLDPAPGIDTAVLERSVKAVPPAKRSQEMVRRVLATPEYQLA